MHGEAVPAVVSAREETCARRLPSHTGNRPPVCCYIGHRAARPGPHRQTPVVETGHGNARRPGRDAGGPAAERLSCEHARGAAAEQLASPSVTSELGAGGHELWSLSGGCWLQPCEARQVQGQGQ
jgi:hypothetical protein